MADVEKVERVWTRWTDKRPPNEKGAYRYRAPFNLLGVDVFPEWTSEMHLCGMGFGDAEWWPLNECRWNGYRRFITNSDLEWSPVVEADKAGILWNGLELLPCPFTGRQPNIESQGKYIGAPLWETEAVWISSRAVPQKRWTNAKAMTEAWNKRSNPATEQAQSAALAAMQAEREHELYTTQDADAPEAIRDRNGEVCLSMCKKCGLAESQLDKQPHCQSTQPSPTPDAIAEAIATIPLMQESGLPEGEWDMATFQATKAMVHKRLARKIRTAQERTDDRPNTAD